MAKTGICHICGQHGKLTAEHVPPRRAYNDSTIYLCNPSEFLERSQLPWETEGAKMQQSQRGVVYEVLCERCNNNTGAWYGPAYIDFACQGYRALKNSAHQGQREIGVTFSSVYPLRIIKQILSMFCSINSEDFVSNHPYIQKLILNKEDRGLNPDRYSLFMFSPYASVARYAGVTGVVHFRGDSMDKSVFSEIIAPPYGFVLRLRGDDFSDLGDITFFANHYTYSDASDIHLRIPIKEVHTYFPGDYRSRIEVVDDLLRNRIAEEKRVYRESI